MATVCNHILLGRKPSFVKIRYISQQTTTVNISTLNTNSSTTATINNLLLHLLSLLL